VFGRTIGFSDEHFELKYGLTTLIKKALPPHWHTPQPMRTQWKVLAAPKSRWYREAGAAVSTWEQAAAQIGQGTIFVGCNSALHVLACALGIPVVMMEPSEARWNPIFYPYGTTERVRLVTGNDGRPTFDARHVRDAIEETLRCL
jgi:hypothetical protein